MKRIPTLDGIRGIAILLVLAAHVVDSGALPLGGSRWITAVSAFMWTGWSGVDLFFVLSGFLITGILLDTRQREHRARVFYARRALRIFPLFYLAIVMSVAVMALWPTADLIRREFPTPKEWTLYFVYLQNWEIPVTQHTMPLGHFWSLGVEEQFYLLWPWAVWFVPRKRLAAVCAGGILAAFLVRMMMLQFLPSNSPILLMNTFCRMDTLLMGALCAIAVRSERGSRILHKNIAMAGLISAGVILSIDFVAGEIWSRAFWTQSVGYAALATFYASFLMAAYFQYGSGTKLDLALQSSFLRLLGKYSYGLYVWHVPVLFLGALLGKRFGWWGHSAAGALSYSVLLVSISIAVAALSYELYEKWFLNRKPTFSSDTHTLMQRSIAAITS